MGKQVIIFGNAKMTAEEMKKYADLFIDISRFEKEAIDKFTHIPVKKKEN